MEELYQYLNLCNERHKVIEKEFEKVWKTINGADKKLWAIILLLVGNFATLITVIIKLKLH